MIKNIFLTMLIIIFCCSVVSGAINITVDDKDISYIKWSWNSGLTLTNLSVDGYKVILADLNDNRFVLSDLQPNETHIIKVYTSTDSGTLTTTTNVLPLSSTTNILDLIWYYIFVIIATLFIIAGLYEPYFGFLGFAFSCAGITISLSNGATEFLIYSIYAILIVLSILTAFRKE